MNFQDKTETIKRIFSLCQEVPSVSNRQIATTLGISKTTVSKYLHISEEHGLSAGEVLKLDDDRFDAVFNLGSKKVEFVEPDWDAVRQYLQTRLSWGNQLRTVHSAWVNMYIKVHFPDYTSGELPPNCMSDRTFDRRYVEYLNSIGMGHLTHNPNPNNNFGPASMVEIDTIGDKLKYQDRQGQPHQAVVFTAVLKYSGYIYAEAMASGTSLCWAHAIANAFYHFGGCTQALRCDNDTALSKHGCKKGDKRLRASIEFVLRDFDVASDFCPVRYPEYKGTNERSNLHLQRHLFEEFPAGKPIVADNLDELNQMIRLELLRINSASGKQGFLSRMVIFEKYEKNCLLPLPLFRPEIKSVSFGHVGRNGYVRYLRNFYFAGFENAAKDIIIVNDLGKRIYLKIDNQKQTSIADYEIDRNCISPRYHKADNFKTPQENIAARDMNWFMDYFNGLKGEHGQIISTVEWLFKIFSASNQVATRLCNQLCNIYQNSPEDLDCLEAACGQLLKKKLKTDLKTQIYAMYNTYVQIKDMGTDLFDKHLSRQRPDKEVATATPSDDNHTTGGEDDSVRGEDYFNDLC